VTQTGTTANAQGPVSGQCGPIMSADIPVTLSSSTATSVDFSFGGQSFTAVRDGLSLAVTNNVNDACSDSATCIDGNCKSSASLMQLPLGLVAIIMLFCLSWL